MAKAVTGRSLEPYVLEADRNLPEHEQTTFMLGSLTGLDWLEVQSVGERAVSPMERELRMRAEACKRQLHGWDVLTDQQGKSVPFPGKGAAAVDHLDPGNMAELGLAIIRRSRLRGEDVGKSVSPSGSQPDGSEADASPASKPTRVKRPASAPAT